MNKIKRVHQYSIIFLFSFGLKAQLLSLFFFKSQIWFCGPNATMFLLGHGPIHCGIEPPDLCVKQENNWMLNISSHYLHMSFLWGNYVSISTELNIHLSKCLWRNVHGMHTIFFDFTYPDKCCSWKP